VSPSHRTQISFPPGRVPPVAREVQFNATEPTPADTTKNCTAERFGGYDASQYNDLVSR
jgi:hypothetical protein